MEHDRDALGAAPPVGGEVGWYRDPDETVGHHYWDGLRWLRAPEGSEAPHAPPMPRTVAPGRDVVTAAELWWHPGSDRMVWSPEATLLHGYGGQRPEVTRELMLSHVVDSDRASVAACFDEGRRGVAQLRNRHRMRRADGAGRDVVMVAALDQDGSYHGFLVDLGRHLARAANDAVEAARHGNAAVQGAIGVLGVVLGLDGEAALAVLRRSSTDNNVKLRDVAQQVSTAAVELSAEPGRAPARLRRMLQHPRRPAARTATGRPDLPAGGA